jgi:glycosyltransferase involved in cell wall biosynthesis
VNGRLVFLLGKDPATERGGDMTMAGLLAAIAGEWFDVQVVCLSADVGSAPDDGPDDGIVRVSKPPVSTTSLLARSLRLGRSLVHTRFDVPALTDAISATSADRFVAIHSYMAEAYLRSPAAKPDRELVVSTEVSETTVWAETRGRLAQVDRPRLWRDELRVARAARSVGAYEHSEINRYRAHEIGACWLDVSLPPAEQVDVAATSPQLVFLGNRSWPPNARAAEAVVNLWPRISSGINGARLLLVGDPGKRLGPLPPGVTDAGQIDDVDTALAGCRAMVAPVSVGGGVRVKVLEAAARGLPVVASPAAVGSIESELGITSTANEDAFVDQCRTYLQDATVAGAEGARLHAVNEQRWRARVGQDAVRRWLAA